MKRNKMKSAFASVALLTVLVIAGASVYAQCSYSGGSSKSKDKSSTAMSPQVTTSQADQDQGANTSGTSASEAVQGSGAADSGQSN